MYSQKILEALIKSQVESLETKYLIVEISNLIEVFNSRFHMAKKKNCKLEGRASGCRCSECSIGRQKHK